MKTNRPLAKLGLIIAAAVALSGAVIMTACGKLKSENIPSAGEQSLAVDVVNATKGSDGRYSVRANGRDTIEFVATVKGLSSSVGFYVPSTWGTFAGGTLSATNGFTYYPADRSGKARATLTSTLTGTGRIEMVARSLDVEKIIPLSFDFATLTIFPSALTIFDTYHYDLVARGGAAPIEWSVSHPGLLGFTSWGESIEIWPLVDPSEYATTPPVTVSARDAEGTVATAIVTLSPPSTLLTCSISSIAVAPAAPSAAAGAATISVTVVDYSKRSAPSITVQLSGAISGTLALNQWGSAGIFQGTYIIPVPVISRPYTFSHSGTGATCLPAVNSATVTPIA